MVDSMEISVYNTSMNTKLKISLVSDLHLDYGFQALPGGDVLLLAGDICEYRTLKRDCTLRNSQEANALDHKPGVYPAYDFFYNECAKYEQVFMVMGNHEHYHHRFDKTYEDFKALLPSNVTLLEKEYVEYRGVVFLGGTLWTNLNRGDPVTVFAVKGFMNDYKAIQNYYPARNLYHKLTPEDTGNEHKKTMEYFKQVLSEKHDQPVVVITHMAPSFMSVDEKFKNEHTTNGAYASELSEFILDHANIRAWVHGHMHDGVDYMIGSTRVMCNPRGYVPWEANNGFDPAFAFEV